MRVLIDKNNTNNEFPFSGSAQELLTQLHINPETVIIAKNNQLITLDEHLNDQDEVRIIAILSGG